MDVTVTTKATSSTEPAHPATPDRLLFCFNLKGLQATRNFEALQLFTALPLGCLLLALLSFPAETIGAAASTEASASQPEEITITGKRSLFQLREEMWSSEQEAYELFNRFNDEARFNIDCRMHEPLGTRIKRQVCTPEFQLEATRQHAQNYFYSFGHYMPLEATIASQMQAFREKMKQLAEEHPEFLEAVIRHSEIRQQYESAIGSRPHQDIAE